MKIACCWMYAIDKYGFPPSLEHMLTAIGEMAGMGFEYIELEGVGYENLAAVVAGRQKIKEACVSAGVRVSNFAALLPDIISADEAKVGRALAMFEQGAETAAYLGSPHIWIDSYFPPLEVLEGALMTDAIKFGQQYRVRVPDGFDWPAFWAHFVDVIRRCTAIARRHGVRLLVEPRVGEVTPNVDSLLRLADAVHDDNFGVIFDTAHEHAQKELLPLSIEKLGPLLKYVHVADNDGLANWHREPGSGTIDWDEIFRGLKRHGFDGYFAIDLEEMPDLEQKFMASKRFLEDHARRWEL